MIRKSRSGSAFSLADNSELPMFYLTQFLKDNVYFCKELNVYAAARIKEGDLLLYDVFLAEKSDRSALDSPPQTGQALRPESYRKKILTYLSGEKGWIALQHGA